MLDRAATEMDMTLGRYIETALRAQFRKDGIVPVKQLEQMNQLLMYKAVVETELAKGKQVELSVLIDGELYALRRRDTIREQDKTIKSARKRRGGRDYKLVHMEKAFEEPMYMLAYPKIHGWLPRWRRIQKTPDIVVDPSKPGSPSLMIDLKNSEKP
jgi:hypothetical protein